MIEGPGFRIPFNVIDSGSAIVRAWLPDVSLTERQKEKLTAVLNEAAFNVSDRGWFMFETKVPGRAIEGFDKDPEDFLLWVPEAFDAAGYSPENPDEFYLSFFQKTGTMVIDSPEGVRSILYWLCAHMLDWMGNKGKPIDLYFCKLHPMPYRINWKNILIYWDKKAPPIMIPGYPRPLKLCRYFPHMYQRMGEEFLKGELVGLDKDTGTAQWTLDVEHLPSWFEHIKKVESERKKRRGVHYMDGVLNNMKRRFIDAMKLYGQFLYGCSAKCVHFTFGWREKRLVLVAEKGAQVVHNSHGTNRLLDPKPLEAVQEDRPDGLPEATTDMLELSNLQPETLDLRNTK